MGYEHTRKNLREGAVDAVALRLEPWIPVLVELDAQTCFGGRVGELSAEIGVELVAVRVAPCELAQERAERVRACKRRGVHMSASRHEPPRAEPRAELVRRRDVVLVPHRDLGVHEVLHEVERRRCRSASGGLEPGPSSARHR